MEQTTAWQRDDVAGTTLDSARHAAAPDLGDPSLYVNRELSWLDFNERVLALAEDGDLPLLERAKFLAIYSSNLDEFVMVRVAGLHDQVDAGIDARGPDNLPPAEVLERIAVRLRELGRRHVDAFEDDVRPRLADHGVRIARMRDLDADGRAQVQARFHEQIFPVLTPLAVGPGRPFPYISNLSLSLAVLLRDPSSEGHVFARVKVPKEVLPRFVEIAESEALVPLEEVISANLEALFPGMEILEHGAFRVTRDADFTVSDEADDLLAAVENELRRRRFGEVVRLELSAGMNPALRAELVEAMELEENQVVESEGLLDLGDLMSLVGLEGHSDLRDEPWTPVTRPSLRGEEDHKVDMFAVMREGDLLIHHPYESFATSVERLVDQAVEDPDVLAIKQTVYRTSDDSALVPALIKASEKGKQAVCMVELKARFDEEANIAWARALEQAGVHVVHGLPGLKTHAKAVLVVRREGNGIRHYVHIGTGNYNSSTARLYTDLGLFTSRADIGADVADLFNHLTGHAQPRRYRKLLVAPNHLRDRILEEINATIEAHSPASPARIAMKMNSLVDSACIRALYEASRAGVQVDLSVRGICCLLPAVPGVSENVRVVSIVGRFLEHARIYGFQRNGEEHYYIGSADLMPRNLDNRVELLAPVEEAAAMGELREILEVSLSDTVNGWELGADGGYHKRTPPPGAEPLSAQQTLMQRAIERAAEGESHG